MVLYVSLLSTRFAPLLKHARVTKSVHGKPFAVQGLDGGQGVDSPGLDTNVRMGRTIHYPVWPRVRRLRRSGPPESFCKRPQGPSHDNALHVPCCGCCSRFRGGGSRFQRGGSPLASTLTPTDLSTLRATREWLSLHSWHPLSRSGQVHNNQRH